MGEYIYNQMETKKLAYELRETALLMIIFRGKENKKIYTLVANQLRAAAKRIESMDEMNGILVKEIARMQSGETVSLPGGPDEMTEIIKAIEQGKTAYCDVCAKMDDADCIRCENERIAEAVYSLYHSKRHHGKWKLVMKYDDGIKVFRCSECSVPRPTEFKYCPSCGAIMDIQDGDENGN